ncbi:MAG: UrcA family protein, partial [Rhizomicrobium sp.]|nr:UrcA family protein [Rhizomicrobium sp.]
SSGGYQPRSATVSYGDLDVTSAQGSAALVNRIDAASRAVCGERTGPMMAGDRARDFAACRSAAIADALRNVGLTAPTAYAAR